MIYIDELKDLYIYKRQFFLPRNGQDKRKNCAAFLLTPNYESSMKLINNPLIQNKYYNAYYMERDINLLLSESMELTTMQNRNYVHETETGKDVFYVNESGAYENYTQSIVYNGYDSDVAAVREIINIAALERYNERFKAPIKYPIAVTVYSDDCDGIPYTTDKEIAIYRYSQDEDDYKHFVDYCIAEIYTLILRSLNPNADGGLIHACASVLSGSVNSFEQDFPGMTLPDGYKKVMEILDKPNGYHELIYVIKNNLVGNILNPLQEAELPFLTKLKRKISMQTRKGGMHKINHTLDDIEIGAKLGATTHRGKTKSENQVDIPTLDGIKDEIEQASRISSTSSNSNSEEENVEEAVMGYEFINYGESYIGEGFMKSGDVITFFDEAVDKSSGLLRRMLYRERIKTNKELTLIYDGVKRDCPKITRTHLDLKRYKQFNIFIDAYYYNNLFFENNMYKLDRGVDLYKEFLDRILHNENIEALGYTKNVLFIPVMDWVDDIKTKSYIYRNDINPISMIYRLMIKDLPGLKKLFNMPVVFMGNGTYFKVDFNRFETKDINLFVQKLKQLYKANFVDDDEVVSKDSKAAIVDDIIDDIEDSQNIKMHALTGQELKEAPKNAEQAKDKEKEDTKKAIKDRIEKAAEDSADKEEALEKLDDDETFKKMILQLQDDNDSGVQMNASRTARMTELNNAILNKEVKGKKVRDILEQRRSLNEKPLEKTVIPIDTADEEWKELVYPSMNKQYDPNDDIVAMLYDLTKKSFPISIRDINVEDTSTSEDYIYTYTVDMENHLGKRFKLRFDIPRLVNNQYMVLRGNKKTINTQSFLMPVLKTDEDTAQIISNYNKIFIRRFNTSTGRSNAIADRLIKTLNKNKFKNITVEVGNNSMISNRYDLPIDYIDLSTVFTKIETSEVVLLFNYQEMLNMKGVDLSRGIPLGYNKKNKETIYYRDQDPTLSRFVLSFLIGDDEFRNTFESTKAAAKATYSKASILNVEIPLIVVAGFSVGLTKVLDRAKINYEFKEKITNAEKKDDNTDYIKFSDGYLIYNNSYEASLLLNGLKECDTENYSVMDVNNKSMFLDFLDDFGGKLKADGIDNFYDCMIDPISADVLTHYKLPDNYIDLLIYANNLLIDNKYIKFSSTEGRRLRRNELIAAYFYKALSSAYGSYSASLKHGRDTILSMKQTAVIDLILLDPTCSDLSIINPLSEKEAYDTVSAKGLSGMNSDRSFSLDKRAFDDSMINTLALSTGFASTVGINRQATINANVDTVRGYIGNSDDKEMGTTNTLCIAEALTPMGTTHDDPFRSAMTFVQTTKHGMRVDKSNPLLITNGADKALLYLISDIFAHKAKNKGEVVELEEDFMIIKYEDGTHEYVDLSAKVEKNSSAGFYVELKLSADSSIKKGSKVKPNQIVAYDHSCFSPNTGISLDIAYDIGTLVLCALMDTDEGFEDSAIVSEALSEAMRSDIIVQKELNLSKDTNIYNIVAPGTPVQEGDTLMVMQSPFDEEDANALLKTLADDIGEISDLGRIPIKSKVTGIVQDIQIYRTVELEELSESLRALCKKYEAKDNNKRKAMKQYGIQEEYKLRPNYKLNATGKLKGASDGVMIVFSLKYSDKLSVGDKVIYYSANKGVIKDIFPEGKEPYFLHDKDKEKLDTLVSIASTNARMVTVIQNTGVLNYLLVEASKKAKEIAGIKYKKRLLTD